MCDVSLIKRSVLETSLWFLLIINILGQGGFSGYYPDPKFPTGLTDLPDVFRCR